MCELYLYVGELLLDTQAMELYRYRRLKEPEDGVVNFRLLKLFRGAFDDDIYVAIDERSLELSGASPSQESKINGVWFALSYTWGDLRDFSKVIVRSACTSSGAAQHAADESYIPVTKNLTEALRHVRCDYDERFLWVDAICIDQSDDDEALRERAWQVQAMHYLYAQATGVIIWLGTEADDSTYALESLHRLGSSILVDWKTSEIYTLEGKPSKSMEVWYDQQRSLRDRKAVADLLERPWFGRVWIRQEAFFAKENTSAVFCGNAFVSFAEMRRAIHYLGCLGMDNSRQNIRLALALSICQREFSDEPNLLRRIRGSDCRDPRDRVYGILGILTLNRESQRAVPVQVDYSVSNSVEKVYKDFFLRYVERYGTLRLLDEAGLYQGSGMRPTWIPDWRSNVIEQQLDLSLESATSHFSRAECQFSEQGILKVLGRYAERVTKVHVLGSAKAKQPGSDSWEELDSDSWRELAILMHWDLGSLEAETAIQRVTHAICCVLEPTGFRISDFERCREEVMKYVSYLYNEAQETSKDRGLVIKSPTEIISSDAAARVVQCVRYLRMEGAPALFSAGQYLGIGPRNAKSGDQIWAILGSRALILLREVDKGKYEVVGPCFVHGFNWGEALLGPLPEHYTVVPRLQEARGHYVPYYTDTKTGLASMWDPRIAWEELEPHPPMVNFDIMTAPPGEPFRVRPDFDYLQRHGIRIQQIDLV